MNRYKIRGLVLYAAVLLALLWGLAVFTGVGRKDRVSYAAVGQVTLQPFPEVLPHCHLCAGKTTAEQTGYFIIFSHIQYIL